MCSWICRDGWPIHEAGSQYPVLSRIARDILAVPASVVPFESAFSTGQRVVSDYRCRLKSTTVETLICLQDWLKHVQSLAHIVDEDDLWGGMINEEVRRWILFTKYLYCNVFHSLCLHTKTSGLDYQIILVDYCCVPPICWNATPVL
jgi:hypothetical protein